MWLIGWRSEDIEMIDPVKHEVMADMRIYQASTRVFKLGLLLWNRIKISGSRAYSGSGGVMIASNHVSYLDPAIVGVGYRRRRCILWHGIR